MDEKFIVPASLSSGLVHVLNSREVLQRNIDVRKVIMLGLVLLEHQNDYRQSLLLENFDRIDGSIQLWDLIGSPALRLQVVHLIVNKAFLT